MVTMGWRRGKKEMVRCKGDRVAVWNDDKVPKKDGGDGCILGKVNAT